MFEKYGFVLEWDELSDEVQQQKIDDVITFDYKNGNFETEIEGQPISLDTFLTDDEERNKAEEYIATHFPIYF